MNSRTRRPQKIDWRKRIWIVAGGHDSFGSDVFICVRFALRFDGVFSPGMSLTSEALLLCLHIAFWNESCSSWSPASLQRTGNRLLIVRRLSKSSWPPRFSLSFFASFRFCNEFLFFCILEELQTLFVSWLHDSMMNIVLRSLGAAKRTWKPVRRGCLRCNEMWRWILQTFHRRS